MKALFLATLCVLLSSCVSSQTSDSNKLFIAFSGNRQAELEPCGCSVRPLGGVHREWNLIQSWENPANENMFYLVGGSTFRGDKYEPRFKEHYQRKAGFVIKALERLGVHVVSPSAEDFQLGSKTITSLAKSSKLNFVSSNLYSKATNKPFFDTHYARSAFGTQVMVLGISDKERAPKDVLVKPFTEVLPPLLAKVDKNAFVIVLSSLSPKERETLIQEFPRVNLVLGGKPNDPITSGLLQASPNTLYNKPEYQGRELSLMEFEVNPPWNFFYAEEAARYSESKEIWTRRLAELKKLKPTKSRKKTVSRLEASLKKIEGIALNPSPASANVQSKTFDLDKSFESSDEPNPLRELVEAYKAAVRAVALEEGK